jgi:hypothetical protein
MLPENSSSFNNFSSVQSFENYLSSMLGGGTEAASKTAAESLWRE